MQPPPLFPLSRIATSLCVAMSISLLTTATTTPTKEGFIDFKVQSINRVTQTWYKIIGQLKPGVRPLIALHGGPGVTSDYLEILSDITKGRPGPLIIYDQIGNGKSTHLREKMGDTKFWTDKPFADELNNLITKLNIKEYDLLGHSWGGMLAARHAVSRPPGLKHLVLSSSPASMPLWSEAQNCHRSKLPKDAQAALDKFDQDGIETPGYQDAVSLYYSIHLCTIDPFPAGIAAAFAAIADDPTVYLTMNGPSEFQVTGTLKNWTIIDELWKINVPTLLTNGAADEAADSVMAPSVRNIPDVKWVQFKKSSHMAHYEQRREFMETVARFLYSS